MRPYYKGCLAGHELCTTNLYCIPAIGYMSLSGVFCALLHTVNFDRVQKGLPPLKADALDSTNLTTLLRSYWEMPYPGHYLAFEVR